MFDHDGWMVFGGGFMWLFWVVVILIIVIGLRSLMNSGTAGNSSSGDTPMEILKKRYARGEIDDEEYEHRRKELER